MFIKRFILISSIFFVLCHSTIANEQKDLDSLCKDAVSAMLIDDFATTKENYDAAIALISTHSTSDLVFSIPENLVEYVIVNIAKQNSEEALNYSNILLELQMQSLMYYASKGYFPTKEDYIDNVSNTIIGMGYVLAEAGLMKEAEDCIKSGIAIYPSAEVFSENYPLCYERMAYFYSEYCMDYIKELEHQYEGFKAAISLYGIDSQISRQIFGQLCISYAWNFAFLAICESGDEFSDYDLRIVSYENLIQLYGLWDQYRNEIIDKFGKETFLSLLSVEPVDIEGCEDIIFGLKEWDLLYMSLAAIHYGKIVGYEEYNRQMLSIIQTFDEALAYSKEIIRSLRNHNYVNLALKLYDELSVMVSNRKDLVEMMDVSAGSMAYAYGFHDKAWEYVDDLSKAPYTYDYSNVQTYIEGLGLLAALYSERNDYQKCIEILCYAIEKMNANSLFVSKDIQSTLYNNLSVAYGEINEEDSCFNALNHAIELRKSNAEDFGENPDDPNSILWPAVEYGNMSDYYIDKGMLAEAEKLLKDCLSHFNHNYPNSVKIISIYDRLTYIAQEQGKYDDMRKWAELSYNHLLRIYLEGSFDMTKVQRTDYWRKIYSGNFEIFSQFSVENSSFTDLAYNSALIQKGFLLKYDAVITNNILCSGDQDLIQTYKDFKNAESRGMPEKYYLEEKMMYLYSKHKHFIRDVSFPTWKDVQNQLLKGDISIEFAKCCSDGQNVSYAALLLRQGWDAPVVIKLSSEREMNALFVKGSNAYLDNDRFYSMIWERIEPYLKGVKRIFFSPYGVLAQMNIEALKNKKGKVMNDEYDMYRLSSTAQLYEETDIEYTNATLFGGLNYDLDTDSMQYISRNYYDEGIRTDYIIQYDESVTRKGWNYLPGTKKEVEQISNILDKASIQNTLLVSEAGTEESFKSLSGRSPQILHMATHGFYLTQKQAERSNPNILKTRENDSHVYPLRRCGLIMSGGQHAWLGENLPNEIDDGILTAEEVSGLNLSGTDLLVLSACQTGLGDIGDEGVYGLQRGFKLAGVSTIIMSLWEVNDEVTSLMMQEFYSNLVKGKSKRESFYDAQNEVRKKYDSPYYWAAFIMLD